MPTHGRGDTQKYGPSPVSISMSKHSTCMSNNPGGRHYVQTHPVMDFSRHGLHGSPGIETAVWIVWTARQGALHLLAFEHVSLVLRSPPLCLSYGGF